jgi:cell filamentation protein
MIFDPFGDFAINGYLRNFAAEKHSEIISRLEHQAYREALLEALTYLAGKRRLNYADILETHRIVFSIVYPWAGQDRQSLAPQIAIGKAGRYDLFAHPKDIRKAAEFGLAQGNDKAAMRARPGTVMGYLAHAHPFLDGNGRTILVIHAQLARRAGFVIDWLRISKLDYLKALTEELERPGTVMDAFLAPYIMASGAAKDDDLAALRDNPELGPNTTGDGRLS